MTPNRNEGRSIRERAATLRGWTRELAAALVQVGGKVFPSETYFFLADFSPHNAQDLAKRLEERSLKAAGP